MKRRCGMLILPNCSIKQTLRKLLPSKTLSSGYETWMSLPKGSEITWMLRPKKLSWLHWKSKERSFKRSTIFFRISFSRTQTNGNLPSKTFHLLYRKISPNSSGSFNRSIQLQNSLERTNIHMTQSFLKKLLPSFICRSRNSAKKTMTWWKRINSSKILWTKLLITALTNFPQLRTSPAAWVTTNSTKIFRLLLRDSIPLQRLKRRALKRKCSKQRASSRCRK